MIIECVKIIYHLIAMNNYQCIHHIIPTPIPITPIPITNKKLPIVSLPIPMENYYKCNYISSKIIEIKPSDK